MDFFKRKDDENENNKKIQVNQIDHEEEAQSKESNDSQSDNISYKLDNSIPDDKKEDPLMLYQKVENDLNNYEYEQLKTNNKIKKKFVVQSFVPERAQPKKIEDLDVKLDLNEGKELYTLLRIPLVQSYITKIIPSQIEKIENQLLNEFWRDEEKEVPELKNIPLLKQFSNWVKEKSDDLITPEAKQLRDTINSHKTQEIANEENRTDAIKGLSVSISETNTDGDGKIIETPNTECMVFDKNGNIIGPGGEKIEEGSNLPSCDEMQTAKVKPEENRDSVSILQAQAAEEKKEEKKEEEQIKTEEEQIKTEEEQIKTEEEKLDRHIIQVNEDVFQGVLDDEENIVRETENINIKKNELDIKKNNYIIEFIDMITIKISNFKININKLNRYDRSSIKVHIGVMSKHHFINNELIKYRINKEYYDNGIKLYYAYKRKYIKTIIDITKSLEDGISIQTELENKIRILIIKINMETNEDTKRIYCEQVTRLIDVYNTLFNIIKNYEKDIHEKNFDSCTNLDNTCILFGKDNDEESVDNLSTNDLILVDDANSN